MRWVPAHPTYVMSSATLGDAQHSLRDTVELVGAVTGYDLNDVTAALGGLLGVDPLHPEPLAALGIDVAGSWAVFSEAFEPTFVIHLSAPDQIAKFLEHQRSRGLVTQSVVVDQVEVSSAALLDGLAVSWAIAGDWLWVHAGRDAKDTSWLAQSRAPHAPGWASDWAWAQRAAGAAAGVVGLFELEGLLPRAVLAGDQAIQCAKLLAPVRRVGLALEADDHHFAARVTLDVGTTAGITPMVIAPPGGWAAASANAAAGAQWNLDLAQLQTALAPCFALTGNPLAGLGVRTARGFLIDADPEQLQGSGAVAFDLSDGSFFRRQLDRIPLRSQLERAETFGGHRGASLSVPFGPTVEYALDNQLFAAALGEGLLARVLAPGSAPAPIFAVDVQPPKLSPQAWAAVLHVLFTGDIAGSPGKRAQRMAERMLRWRDGHAAITTTPSELVLAISGTRR